MKIDKNELLIGMEMVSQISADTYSGHRRKKNSDLFKQKAKEKQEKPDFLLRLL